MHARDADASRLRMKLRQKGCPKPQLALSEHFSEGNWFNKSAFQKVCPCRSQPVMRFQNVSLSKDRSILHFKRETQSPKFCSSASDTNLLVPDRKLKAQSPKHLTGSSLHDWTRVNSDGALLSVGKAGLVASVFCGI